MRVLHIFKCYYSQSKGGIEKAIQQLMLSTTSLGVENTLLCIQEPEARNHGELNSKSRLKVGGKVYAALPSLRYDSITLSLPMVSSFKKLAAEHDVIHYHFPFPQQDLLHLFIRPEKPSILSYHSDIIRQRFLYFFYRPLMYKFLSRVDLIVSSSENYLNSSAVLQRFSEKIRIVPFGLDENAYPALDHELRHSWIQRAGRDFFLFIGVLRYYKGLDILLEAAARCSHNIVIAGSGPMDDSLRRKAMKLNLKNIFFSGPVSEADKVALFSICRAVVFPSLQRSEAFGMTLVEGSMFSKPLISTELKTGTSFINKHGQTGLVIPPGDPAALAEAVNILGSDHEMAVKMGQNARKRYEELFTAEKYAREYLKLYNSLIGCPFH